MDIFRDIPPQTSLHTVVCLMSIIDRRAAAVDPLDYQFLSDYHTEKKNSSCTRIRGRISRTLNAMSARAEEQKNRTVAGKIWKQS